MDTKPRYRLRRDSAALSRFQWWIVGVAILIGTFGVVLAITGRVVLGAMLMSLSGLINGFTVVIASSRRPNM
jgi:hypothetical protein